jgi:predicted Zn-ribbon and HTH transcriptional regulator
VFLEVFEMFTCEYCGFEFDDDEMSDVHNMCNDCEDDAATEVLVALGII